MKRLCVIVILFALMQTVAAESFSVFSLPEEVAACSCGAGSLSFAVLNNNPMQESVTFVVGDGKEAFSAQTPIPSSYTVELSGKAAKWSSVSPARFTLVSGEQQLVTLYWEVPCNVRSDKSLGVRVRTDFGVIQEFELDIAARQCQNIGLLPQKSRFEGCACSPIILEYLLSNTGSWTEQYTVGMNRFAGYAQVSENPVILGAGETKRVNLYVTAPCDRFGSFNGMLSVEAEANGIVAETPYQITLKHCTEFEAYFGEPGQAMFAPFDEHYELCESQSTTIPLLFTNVGMRANTFDFRLKAPGWASLSADRLSLSPEQAKVLFIEMDVPAGLEDSFVFRLDVGSALSGVESQIEIPLTVENCHRPAFEPARLEVGYAEQSTQVAITNTGARVAEYELSLHGLNWASVDEPQLSVGPGLTGVFHVRTTPPAEARQGTYASTVSATAGGVEYQQELMIKLRQERNIFESLVNLFAAYKWYLIGALLVLIIIIVLLAKRPRKKRRRRRVVKEVMMPKKEMVAEPGARREYMWIGLLALLILLLTTGFIWFAYNFFQPGEAEPAIPLNETVVPAEVPEEPVEVPEEPEEEGLSIGERIIGFFGLYKWYFIFALLILLASAIFMAYSQRRPEEEVPKKRYVEKLLDEKKIAKKEPEIPVIREERRPAKRVVSAKRPWWLIAVLLLIIVGGAVGLFLLAGQVFKGEPEVEYEPPEGVTPGFTIVQDENVTVEPVAEGPSLFGRLMSSIGLYKWYFIVSLLILIVLLFLFLRSPGRPTRRKVVSAESNWGVIVLIILILILGFLIVFFSVKWYSERGEPAAEYEPPEGITPGFTVAPEDNVTAEPVEEAGFYSRLKSLVCSYYWHVVLGLVAVLAVLFIIRFWPMVSVRKPFFGLIALIVIVILLVICYFVCFPPFKGAPEVAPEEIPEEPEEIPGEAVEEPVEPAPGEPQYEQDELLSVIEDGVYAYDEQGEVVNTETGERIRTSEFVQLLKDNRELIVMETSVTALELNRMIAGLEAVAAMEAEEPAEEPAVEPEEPIIEPEEPAVEPEEPITEPEEPVIEPEEPVVEPEEPVEDVTLADLFEGVNCTLEMVMDTPYHADLSESFTDPDMDALSFSATHTENIDVKIDGDMVEITPKEGFVGVEYVEFRAEDGRGGVAHSGILTVCVKEKSFGVSMGGFWDGVKQYFRLYWAYVILGLIILVVLIAIIRHFQPDREVEKENNKKK